MSTTIDVLLNYTPSTLLNNGKYDQFRNVQQNKHGRKIQPIRKSLPIVTSGSRRTERTLKISFKMSKCAISKNAQDGRPDSVGFDAGRLEGVER